ncbi:MAG: hypothetical protein ACK4LB_00820 [Spirosomataceae bacterium]
MMEQPEKNNTVVKAVLVLAIAFATLFGFLYFSARQEVDQRAIDNSELTKELLLTNTKLDSISAQLDARIAEVSALGGQVEELEAIKARLEEDKRRLINGKDVSMKEYKAKIKNYEALLAEKDNEIGKLREENRLLASANENLSSENSNLRTEKSSLLSEKAALSDSVTSYSRSNRELKEKVTLAAALKAMNISIAAINSRGKERDGETFRARRVDRIKVAFKLAENPLTKRENKVIYLRLLDTQGNVIADNATGSGTFMFGAKEMQYSSKQTVLFDNSGQTVEFTYDRNTNYEKGSYTVELYSEGFKIGQSQFIIK